MKAVPVCSRPSSKRTVERSDRLAQVVVKSMNVEIHRRADLRMAEDRLHELGLHALGDQQRAARVAQIVEP